MKKINVTMTIEVKVANPSAIDEVVEVTRERLEELLNETDDDLADFLDWETPDEDEEESEI